MGTYHQSLWLNIIIQSLWLNITSQSLWLNIKTIHCGSVSKSVTVARPLRSQSLWLRVVSCGLLWVVTLGVRHCGSGSSVSKFVFTFVLLFRKDTFQFFIFSFCTIPTYIFYTVWTTTNLDFALDPLPGGFREWFCLISMIRVIMMH